MGYTIEATCNTCKTTQTFSLGQSIQDCNLEVVLSHFPVVAQSRIKNFFSIHNNSSSIIWNYETKLGYCSHCNVIRPYPSICLLIEEQKEVIDGKCDCGQAYQLLVDNCMSDQQLISVPCTCQDGTLLIHNIGKWD